jgi:hypothetical protein
MKKLYALIAAVLLLYSASQAQINCGGTPLSQVYSLSSAAIETTVLPAFDLTRIALEDAEDQKMGNYPKIGRVLPVGIALADIQAWNDLPDGGRIWRQSLLSEGALALSVQFEDFAIPAGARLYIYSKDGLHQLGGYTDRNNNASGVFSTQLIPADEVVVEYYEPADARGQGSFTIAGVLHAYRLVSEAGQNNADRDFGDSESCQVNANCTEGNNWQDEKRGVVRILVFEGQSAGWCSGSLVNNTSLNCSPYILTALHCGENASTSNMNQWVFYFNYESSGCNSPNNESQIPNNTLTGCARIADSDDGGGNNGSDFLLVLLNNNVPSNFNAYYNGWRSNNVTSSSGVSIHHPSGDIKKISTYTSNLVSSAWGSANGSHWTVTWSGTANGHGVTEGGSSGSPIFDNQGRIVGTLTGGSSLCNFPNSPDLYGKMSYHWSSNPGDDLRDFLDPGNTGLTTLEGTYAPCGGSDCAADIPYSLSDPCVIAVIAEDDFCCNSQWDSQCQELYDICVDENGTNDCEAVIPYPFNDPCVQEVIAEDDFCCNTEWDNICQEAYDLCNGGGGGNNCNAGQVSAPLSVAICPNAATTFNASGAQLPAGAGYGIQFVPNGGGGGNGTGFIFTGVTLPVTIDAALGGVLAANSLPNLTGQWVLTGLVYTNVNDLENSICSVTQNTKTVNFLPQNHPDCNGTGIDTERATASAWSLFPNPANDRLTLAFNEENWNNTQVEISIISALGSLVYSETIQSAGNQRHNLDISNLAAGMYIVRLNTPKGSSTQKLLVEKR